MKKMIYCLFMVMSLFIMVSASFSENTDRRTNNENEWKPFLMAETWMDGLLRYIITI
jgi:hypothetical protein